MRKSKISKSLFLFFTITLFLLACSKEESTPIESTRQIKNNDCENFPDFYSSSFSEGKFQYKAPYFNPNNPDEFVYFFKDNELGVFELMKYNIKTKEKVTITKVNNIIHGQPKWSVKGLITWTSAPSYVEHIFIIKDNGDSLTQVSSALSNLYPVWSSDGSSLYWQHSPVLGHPYYFLKQDLSNNEKPDTILRVGDLNSGYAAISDISINNQIICQTYIDNNNYIGVGDMNKSPLFLDGIINIIKEFNQDRPRGLCWSSDGRSIYFSMLNLYHFDIVSKKLDPIIDFCDSKRYSIISTSSNGKYLIGERIDSHLIFDLEGNATGEIEENSSIYLIDLESNIETKVNL